MLSILAVDDERPALAELVYLLRRDPRIGHVEPACDGDTALRALDRALRGGTRIDAVFLDVRMPGLDGLDVAAVLSRFAQPVPVVFVSAHDDFAVRAFELRAADYLLKPVCPERLAEAVRRVAEQHGAPDAAGPGRVVGPAVSAATVSVPVPVPAAVPGTDRRVDDDHTVAIDMSGVTRFVRRGDILHVEAYGDYVRLHLRSTSHLLRVPLSTLEEEWRDAGFVRVHRRHLVAVAHIEELAIESGRHWVRVGSTVLPVSRRSARRVRDLLVSPTRVPAHPAPPSAAPSAPRSEPAGQLAERSGSADG